MNGRGRRILGCYKTFLHFDSHVILSNKWDTMARTKRTAARNRLDGHSMEDVWWMGERYAGRPRRLLKAFFPNDIALHCDHGSVNTLIKRLRVTLFVIHPNANPRNRLLGHSDEILDEKAKYIVAEYRRLCDEKRAIERDCDWDEGGDEGGDDDGDADDGGSADNQRFGHAENGDGDGGGGDEKVDGAMDRGHAGGDGDGTGGRGNHDIPKYSVRVEGVNPNHGFQDNGGTKIAIELDNRKITIIIE